ncbi:hypothetical protein L7F22_026288 [Adiantum nelumboides]|nr:hypothetical protein [Adiantum nelumboides]
MPGSPLTNHLKIITGKEGAPLLVVPPKGQRVSPLPSFLPYRSVDMAFKVLSTSQWLIRSSPLCLFKWNKNYNADRDALSHFPVWVEFPNLPLHYHNHMKVIGSDLGRVLGGRPRGEYIPSWHPQALIEMDISVNLPSSMIIGLYDGEAFEQPLNYKYLPNACFHCGVKGHFVRDYPVKHPKPSAEEESTNKGGTQAGANPAPVNAQERPDTKADKPPTVKPAEKPKIRGSNRFALLASLPEWEESDVEESMGQGSKEEEEDPSNR